MPRFKISLQRETLQGAESLLRILNVTVNVTVHERDKILLLASLRSL